ncbi:MAG TPA: hypothetical protein VEK79_22375 [Thermoanaerobaculia bacterium]|nr:hypothetical protein [Thermoanaerobaculia bacterium]
MLSLFAGVFIAIVAVVVYLRRRELAHAQAAVLGGSILPGCVIAEAVVLLLIGVAIALTGR